MEFLYIGFLICMVIWALLPKGRGVFTPPESSFAAPPDIMGYAARDSLFVTRSEQVLYDYLHRALPADLRLHAKVRLEDIVGVSQHVKDSRRRYGLRGRVKSRHVDFLITDARGVPKVVIELDGSSHRSAKAAAGDTLKTHIFAHIAMPLVRVKVGHDFDQAVNDIYAQARKNRPPH